MKEQWIDQIRQKMADYQEPAPEVSWEEIEKAVAGHQQKAKAVPARRKAKAVPMWFHKVAAAILLLVIAGVGYMTLKKDTAPLSSPEGDTNVPRQALRTPHSEQSEQHLKDEELIPSETPLLTKVRQVVRQAIQAERDTVADVVAQVTPTVDSEETAPLKPSERRDSVSLNHSDRTDLPTNSVGKPPLLGRFGGAPTQPSTSPNRLTAKLYLSNAMGNSYHTSISNRLVNSFKMDNLIEEDNSTYQPTDATTASMYTKTVTTMQQVRHHQPIHYGLSLRYRLNKRWGIETGLTYSLLTSDITTKEENTTTQSTQRLNYIGIPLKAEYLIWGSRHFDVYASAGMMVEKMVKGSLEDIDKGAKKSLSIRPLQFSVNSGLGAEYKYNNLLSIFVEPGVAYYFDNGSAVPTFYQDKPLNFNLNLGLRFQFQGE